MLNQITIRPEQASDSHEIATVIQAAFLNAEHTEHTEAFIVNALRKEHALSLSLIATLPNKIIAHIAASKVWLNGNESDWYILAPVSVLPAYQQQGIGSALVTELLTQLKNLGASGCVVLGDPLYYSRFGFIATPKLILQDVPPEYFQAIFFTENQVVETAQQVGIHPAFLATE